MIRKHVVAFDLVVTIDEARDRREAALVAQTRLVTMFGDNYSIANTGAGTMEFPAPHAPRALPSPAGIQWFHWCDRRAQVHRSSKGLGNLRCVCGERLEWDV